MADLAVPQMTLIDLPADVLGCMVRHVQLQDLQIEPRLDGVAALRSVCHVLRSAVDVSVTHAELHANADADELRSTTRRCMGDLRILLHRSCSCIVDVLRFCHLLLHTLCSGIKERLRLIKTPVPLIAQASRASSCSGSAPTPQARQ